MPKLPLYIVHTGRILIISLFLSLVYHTAFPQYRLQYEPVDRDSAFVAGKLHLQSQFRSRFLAEQYISQLKAQLITRGFPTSSIDSVRYDSADATVYLYVGEPFTIGGINTSSIDKELLEASGWREKSFVNRSLETEQLQRLQEQLLNYLENNGYPFARLYLDSIVFEKDKLFARLRLDKGPLYHIDSIRVYGNVKISNRFLQRYLDILPGSVYQKEKLQAISRKILELPYVEEKQSWTMTMLGTGSILNLYLSPKKSSQVNVLVGLLPANTQTINNKILLTGEANINLRNALGNGESIGLNWQHLQVKSPRLDLSFQQPYLFGSPFGITAAFNMLKKDSSYVNLSLLLGLQYSLSANKTGRVFVQHLQTNILTLDTAYIKTYKKLPPQRDVSSFNLGVDYDYNNSNYRFNPVRGTVFNTTITAGVKKIRKNNVIVNLKDPNFSYSSLYDTIKQNSYQFRIIANAAHYFPIGRQSTIKAAINGGWFQSPVIFTNELFQIGGYRLLRGFDEESIYASEYAVATAEYRYLIGLNSFLFSFIDFGVVANRSVDVNTRNAFLGSGVGLAFETKAGIFNISLAAGKRDDAAFNLRQSKIHLGYVNFF
jgi:outer membrane protein assembly factor BamA